MQIRSITALITAKISKIARQSIYFNSQGSKKISILKLNSWSPFVFKLFLYEFFTCFDKVLKSSLIRVTSFYMRFKAWIWEEVCISREPISLSGI